MDAFNSAAAAGMVKPKNLHNPACECVVCTNRRRFEERKQQEAAESARAAAAAAGASEEEQAAAAAAAAADVAGGGADAEAEAKAAKVVLPKSEVRPGFDVVDSAITLLLWMRVGDDDDAGCFMLCGQACREGPNISPPCSEHNRG
jgi:septum formation inhibitor MinC